MNTYELALVIHPVLSNDQQEELLKLVEKIIKQFEGKIEKREEGGRKLMAYPIKKQSEGRYYFFTVTLTPESVGKLDTKLKMEENILRFLLLKK
jgi:small subunit ribosomal protein S6